MLSCLSVSSGPVGRLRHRCSSRYLRISPLHLEFHLPLPDSRLAVSEAVCRLSRHISPLTYQSACAPFIPSESEQRLHPPYYRGCWHGVSRCFLCWYRQTQRVLTAVLSSQSDRVLQPIGPSSLTRRRSVRVSPIAEASRLLPPVGVWAVSQSQCGRTPSQAGYPSSPW